MAKLLPIFCISLSCCVAADLPVREIILYKHGVGYFRRSGDLPAGDPGRLQFKLSEMNDVLKSLTVEDSTGKITGLRYDSNEPLERRLAQFPFYTPGDAAPPTLANLLNHLKGARLELRFGSDTLAGIIVSARTVAAEEKHPEREQVVLLLDSGELRTLDLSGATSVRFVDPKLQSQMRDYLAAVSSARADETRNVYIDSLDRGSRRVQAAYMIPVPVWKSSYRLSFKPSGQPGLEGWAIVDNTSAEDWTNVKLALVSGRPISFISRLYEPKYVQRPSADLPEDQSVGPVVYEAAVAQDAIDAKGKVARQHMLAPMSVAGAAPKPALAEAEVGVAMNTVMVSTAGRELGDLFEYSFSSPVSVRKGESAMLPFLQESVTARKLLIYSDPSAQHPMNAAEIANTTGKTLDGGPITVFEANAYAGEALMETLKNGDKKLISYAVDLGTVIGTKVDSNQLPVREIHARRGLLTARYAFRETRTYSIRNVDQKAKTLIIEEPIMDGYKLVNQTPSETTPNRWRFEVKVPAAGNTTFPVVREREYDNTIQIVNVTPNVLFDYLQNVKLSDAARRQLQAIADKKQQVAQVDASMKQNEGTSSRLIRDQDRLRQNIASLNHVSGQQEQVQKYAKTLADQDLQLAKLRDEQEQLQTRKAALEAELNALMDKMDF